ncbi:MAG: 50S ribosomal protein L3 [Candidatus Aminicenantes bacterium]
MVEGIIGKKIGMTQIFDKNGNAVPGTVLLAGPCMVIQKKTREKDGYSAVQLSFSEEKKSAKMNKPASGHYKKAGVPPAGILREFRYDESTEVKPGDQLTVDMFEVGEKIGIRAKSKGKGFSGVMKRWGFHGGKKSHGSMLHRRPGSIGCSADPSKVMKGKKLPGQLGNQRATVKNLMVVDKEKDKNILVVKGSVPGAKGGYVLIQKTDFLNKSSGKKNRK